MMAKYVSNSILPEERRKSILFDIVFIDAMGTTEEFVFVDSSLSLCVIKCTALINFMFRFHRMNTVYIFPTNSATTFRNVYRQENGLQGEYKLLKCNPNSVLTLDVVRTRWFEDE